MIVGSSTSLWPWRRKPIRSTTTSLLKAKRYSTARWATRATASGSSPLTWKTGIGRRCATSEAKRDDWRFFGSVVKPIRLLTITCTVPPTR